MMDDAALLRRFAEEKSEEAFAELVRRHLDLVYSTALRQLAGDAHLAQDVSQVVFAALACKAAALTDRATLAGWLYLGTQHAAAQAVRTERRRRAREQEAHLMHELLSPATPPTDWDRVRPVLDEAMRELSDADREAVLLRYFERRPFAEIGTALQLGEDAARRRVDRALEKLRGRLARRGIGSTTAALGVALANQAIASAPAGLAGSVTGAAVAAAGAVTPWAGLVNFMANTKMAVAAAGLFAVLAVVTATHETSTRHAAEEALAAAGRDYDAQAAKLRDLARRTPVAEQETARWAKAVEDARAAAVARLAALPPAASPAKPAPALSPFSAGKQFLARHPEVNQALIDWANAKVLSRWGPFLRERQLTPAQIEEFQLLTRAVSLMPYTGPDGPELMLYAGASLRQEEIDRRLHAVLGEQGYAAYDELKGAQRARDLTEQVAASLAFSETPLTPVQSRQLTQAMDRHRTTGDGADEAKFNWDAVMTETRGLLAPGQLAVLAGMRAEDQLRVALDRLSGVPSK